jgi:2-dehydro-3-deoxyglucarate aldolase
LPTNATDAEFKINQMQNNKLKNLLEVGSPTVGCWLALASANVAETMAYCGFDWLVIDTEHVPNDRKDVLAHLRAIAAANQSVDAIVRVANNDATLVKSVLDCGAQNIIFPSINTPEEARAAIASTRYPQEDNGGIRGIAGFVRAAHYGFSKNYLPTANQSVCVILQIESALGLKNVEAITKLDGADCIFIGPADLSASMGHLGNANHPEVQQAIMHIIKACKNAKKSVGIFVGSSEEGKKYRELGINMIALHSDIGWLVKGASEALQEFNKE